MEGSPSRVGKTLKCQSPRSTESKRGMINTDVKLLRVRAKVERGGRNKVQTQLFLSVNVCVCFKARERDTQSRGDAQAMEHQDR